MTGRRTERIAEQIKEEVSFIVAGELEDPRLGAVTVTDATLSPDLRHAKIFVTVIGDQSQVTESLRTLNHAARFIRHELGGTLRLKHVPELHFVHDETARTAARIEELLSEEVQKTQAPERDQNVESE